MTASKKLTNKNSRSEPSNLEKIASSMANGKAIVNMEQAHSNGRVEHLTQASSATIKDMARES